MRSVLIAALLVSLSAAAPYLKQTTLFPRNCDNIGADCVLPFINACCSNTTFTFCNDGNVATFSCGPRLPICRQDDPNLEAKCVSE